MLESGRRDRCNVDTLLYIAAGLQEGRAYRWQNVITLFLPCNFYVVLFIKYTLPFVISDVHQGALVFSHVPFFSVMFRPTPLAFLKGCINFIAGQPIPMFMGNVTAVCHLYIFKIIIKAKASHLQTVTTKMNVTYKVWPQVVQRVWSLSIKFNKLTTPRASSCF